MGKIISTILFGLIAAVAGAVGLKIWLDRDANVQLGVAQQQRAEAEQARAQAEARAAEQARLRAEAEARAAELEKQKRLLAEKLDRLGSERLVAKVNVLAQETATDGSVLATRGVFYEVGRSKGFLQAKVFEVPGDTVHFDALLIQFPKESVAEGDPLRGHTLHLFRRIYGDTQAPTEGLYFDTSRDIPDIYRVNDQPGEYEKQLWDGFWEMALDPKLAESRGVRVAHGQDVYTKLAPGQEYDLILQANGGLIITPRKASSTQAGASGRQEGP